MHGREQDAVNRLAVRRNGRECISASSDGSVIIWDMASFKRRTTFSASTFFNDAAYCSDESQIVTAGLCTCLALKPCMHMRTPCKHSIVS